MDKEVFDAGIAAGEIEKRARGEDLSELQTVRDIFAASGSKGVRQWKLGHLRERAVEAPIRLAVTYAQLGEKDLALEWLEKAWELPLWGHEAAPSCPYYDFLRDDLRFEQLLRKLNLPEDVIQKHLATPEGPP